MKPTFERFEFPALMMLLCIAMTPQPLLGSTVEIPVPLDYRIVEQALEQQVFTGPDGSAEVFSDHLRCNTLVLSEPVVAGTDDGRVRIQTAMRAQTGTPLGDRCRFAKSWLGVVETLQIAQVEPGSSTVSFRVVDSSLLRSDDGDEVLPRFMQGWITDHVHPRLGAVRIDLQPSIEGIREWLDSAVAAPGLETIEMGDLISAVVFSDVQPSKAALVVVLSLEVADAPEGWAPPDEPPLTDDELAQWDATWQAWDGFATWMMKTLALTAGPELGHALAETLLEARHDLRDALAQDDREHDPVRTLFLKTWNRLAPVVHDIQLDLPGRQALQYAIFVSAADALQALDQLAPHIGMRLDSDSLRSLARTLVPAVSDYDLRYDTAIDPDLRQLLGLDPEFEPGSGTGTGDSALTHLMTHLISWLIRDAHAAQISPQLLKRLNSWAPHRAEIDQYLNTVEQLLEEIAQAERGKGKVPDEHFDVYETLLRATAYQESCWRQYVERQGSLETIRSSAGSVGLMQINEHVWRGVYDIDLVHADIGYNARAGNEILVHYLVDYAIRKKEHEITDPPDSLARATYAVYNGGPRHLTRYRNPDASASLKQIDTAFWQKYRAIQAEGPMAVKGCLGG